MVRPAGFLTVGRRPLYGILAAATGLALAAVVGVQMMPRSVARSPDEERLEAGDAVLGACSDLVEVQALAILGTLTPDQMHCLESSLAVAGRASQKRAISRVMLVQAFSAGDTERWEQLMKRHLEEIEQSDPDLCYKYALHLSKKPTPGAAYGVVRWANRGLENRKVWTGSTYTQRVFSLYKIRAVAAQRIWLDLQSPPGSMSGRERERALNDARDLTLTYAREWLAYANVSGKDATLALSLCRSAARTEDACDVR